MALLRVASGGTERLLPLPFLCLVGRGPACLIRVDDPGCPAHWLELRWRGSGWAWRALGAEDRTRARGPFLSDGWRALESGAQRNPRVSLGEHVWIELLDPGPPEPFVWDVVTDAPIPPEAMEEVVERRGNALLPIAAEGDAAQALRDGQCWVDHGPNGPRTLRAHVSAHFAPTLATQLDLARGAVEVELDLRHDTATFTQAGVQARIVGTCIRTLAVYARCRATGDGWMTAAESWAAWSALGGPHDAPPESVAWDRARLRRLLDRAGVGSVDRLFSTRKSAGYTRVRLSDAITDLVELP